MKPVLIAGLLALSLADAHAQFNPPEPPEQHLTVTAGDVTDTREASGWPASLNASVNYSGTDASGRLATARASGSLQVGPGFLTGSMNTAFSGGASASASLTAYQRDTLTFQSSSVPAWDPLIVEYQIVIKGAISASVDPLPGSAGGPAGSLSWTFVHTINTFNVTAWDSTTTLDYNGSTQTTQNWNSEPIDSVFSVFTFQTEARQDSAIPIEFWMELNSTLNASELGTSGSASAQAPTIYWGGLTSVTDEAGNAVDYTVSSASGFNYALTAVPAVPEPSTWLMLAMGCGLLVLLTRLTPWRSPRPGCAGSRPS